MPANDLAALTDGIVEHLVPIPDDADDVCPHCHSAREPIWPQCWSCGRVEEQIGRPCPITIPISFYTRPANGEASSPFRDAMHDFKEHPDPNVRHTAALTVGAIIVQYLLTHRDALIDRFGEWDSMIPVPSTSHDGRPALAVAMDHFADVLAPPVDIMFNGPGKIDRSKPTVDGFVTQRDMRGQRVVLIDDTFTTGAHLQSAAATLTTAGADVAFAVVIARKIQPNPDYPASVNVWERQSAVDFDFDATPFWNR